MNVICVEFFMFARPMIGLLSTERKELSSFYIHFSNNINMIINANNKNKIHGISKFGKFEFARDRSS